ncbi:MAG: hypothetical protein J4F29_22270 [Candidatus Latescibacteria bacterium]|nr:hypothetical protein [Candidatus Latescibacterota bacterium]
MSENISEHTTSITGLTCKPLAILSETISPQEMSMARGGTDYVEPCPRNEDEDVEDPYPCETPDGLPCPCDEEIIESDDGEDSSLWEDVTEIVDDVWDWLTDDDVEEEWPEEEDIEEEETEEEEILEEWP